MRQLWLRLGSSRSLTASCGITLVASQRVCVTLDFDRETRIAVALPSGPQAALAIVAVACTAVAVPIDLQLAAPEVETRLALLRARAVIVLRGSHSVTRNVAVRDSLTVIEAAVEQSNRLGLCFDVPPNQPPGIA